MAVAGLGLLAQPVHAQVRRLKVDQLRAATRVPPKPLRRVLMDEIDDARVVLRGRRFLLVEAAFDRDTLRALGLLPSL